MGYGDHIKTASSAADRKRKQVSEHGRVDRIACADPKRRKRLEADPEKWLKFYLSSAFSRKFEKPHLEIISGAINAHKTGKRFGVSAERGIGKSTVLWGLVLYLKLSGQQPYPICITWAAGSLKRAFRFWKMALCFNDRLAADYPEYCAPFRHAKGVPQRVMTTTWRDTEELTGAQLTVGEGMIVLPDQLGCMGGSTINGNVRGLNHPTSDGLVLRPTLALLDDVQDRKTAKSERQVQDIVDIIDGDIAGCGEAGKDLPMLMSGNCIVPGDVMEHYLTSKDWSGLRVPCILSWPNEWGEDESKCKTLWGEWYDRFIADNDPVKFYKANKKDMTMGMVLSAPSAFKKSKDIPDPEYGAIRTYYKMGHEAFMAEKQQSPERRMYSVYILTPELIQSRVDETRTPLLVPDWAHSIVATTDINPSYALTSTVTAYGKDQTSAVLWYGLYDMTRLRIGKDMTDGEKKLLIYEALAAHGKELAGLACRPNLWVIDGGGSPAGTVIEFCAKSPQICGLESVCAFGRGWKQYRPAAKHKILIGEELYRVVESRGRQWIIWNADYWREMAQKGWTGSPGSPGSCSLPKGNHQEFVTQICREQLKGKDEIGGRTVWVWDSAPGPHDFGDCMAMSYMGAALIGIGTGGKQAQPQRRRQRRVSYVSV